MSKVEERLKQLENKIDDVSKRLNDTQNLINKQHEAMGKFVFDIVKKAVVETMTMREDSEYYEKKGQMSLYFKGLIMGLILGIFGNMFVSYLMECLKGYSIPFWGWTLGTVASYLGILLLLWLLERERKKYSTEEHAQN